MRVEIIHQSGMNGEETRTTIDTSEMEKDPASLLKLLIHFAIHGETGRDNRPTVQAKIIMDDGNEFAWGPTPTVDVAENTQLGRVLNSVNQFLQPSQAPDMQGSDTGDAIADQPKSSDASLGLIMGDSPFCDNCGRITTRHGVGFKCISCGNVMAPCPNCGSIYGNMRYDGRCPECGHEVTSPNSE